MDLFRPRWKQSAWHVREEAANNLTDQAALAEIAKNDRDWRVRLTAAGKITDQAVLADIAKNDRNKVVRKAAAVRGRTRLFEQIRK